MLQTCLLLLALSAPPAEKSAYIPPNLFLVRAKTIEISKRPLEGSPPQPNIPEGRFEITKIYLGPEWLKKYPTFICDHNPPTFGSVAHVMDRLHIRVSYEKGVEGLWWVSYDSNKAGSLRPVLTAPYVDAVGIRPFPYQKMLLEGSRIHTTHKAAEASFQEGLDWADAVEKVYQAASDEERAKLLKGYAVERNPRGAWALTWLGFSKDKELTEFFRKLLADEKLPIASQVAIEQGLLAVDTENWDSSKARQALYQRWRETYRGQFLPISLEVMDAQRIDSRQPPFFLLGSDRPFGQ